MKEIRKLSLENGTKKMETKFKDSGHDCIDDNNINVYSMNGKEISKTQTKNS